MVQVCIKACTQEERYCEPLLSWAIRLDTELVKHKEYIVDTSPGLLHCYSRTQLKATILPQIHFSKLLKKWSLSMQLSFFKLQRQNGMSHARCS